MSDELLSATDECVNCCHDALSAAAFDRLDSGRADREERRLLRRIERNRRLGRLVTRGAMEKFAEEGDVGNWQDFLDWLIKNWPAIIAMIKEIISLFTVT